MMSYKELFIWVEGDNDVEFFKEVSKIILQEKFNVTEELGTPNKLLLQKGEKVIYITFQTYRNTPKEKVKHFLRNIGSYRDAFYIFVGDKNDKPCVTAKKEEIKKIYGAEEDRILVVAREIEGWYLGGLKDEIAKEWGINDLPSDTEGVTKEGFRNLCSLSKYKCSGIHFRKEILKHFSLESAKHKNRSFRYFMERFVPKIKEFCG